MGTKTISTGHNSQYFHLTLGPVQGFVAQARRTRDFWAGSFLLSWLAGVAMVAVKKQQGEINFPLPEQNFLNWLEGKGEPGTEPTQGSIPNRFKAISATVPEDFQPQRVIETVREAWLALGQRVWDMDLKNLDPAQREITKVIWERQNRHFFEISWCITEDAQATNLLDRRKNWRNWSAPEEPGVKCMMMDGWQELSGQPRPGQEVRNFWQQIREQGRAIKTDLRETEHLCTLAYIKRRFVHVFASLSATMPGGWTLYGWQLPRHVPSVSHLAAAHWLAATITKVDPENCLLLEQLHARLSALEGSGEGDNTSLKCVRDALERLPERPAWERLDGQYLFDFILAKEAKGQKGEQALNALREVKKITGTEPSPFYAILLMDGDSLGSQMSDQAKQRPISEALNAFTAKVKGVVEHHNGFLVYAGGDDVLALVTVEDAMTCAYAIRQVWEQCFEKARTGHGINTSISAAIEFCHIKSPLAHGLHDAHQLLDVIAKDKTGRDALAVRVWKSGGQHLEWSAPWSWVVNDEGQLTIPALAATVRQAVEANSGFARGFLNKAESLFATLLPDGRLWPDSDLCEQSLEALLKTYWLQSGKVDGIEPEQLCHDLIEQCRRYYRKDGRVERESGIFCDHALKLVWFLATKEMGRENRQ